MFDNPWRVVPETAGSDSVKWNEVSKIISKSRKNIFLKYLTRKNVRHDIITALVTVNLEV